MQKIILAKEFDVPEWKEPAFTDLLRREEFITYEEATRLGFELSHALYVAREEARSNTVSAGCPRCQSGTAGKSDSPLHNASPPSRFASTLSSFFFNLYDDLRTPEEEMGAIREDSEEENTAEMEMMADNRMFQTRLIDWPWEAEGDPSITNEIRYDHGNGRTDTSLPASWSAGWKTLGGTILR
jgi:hypothetical protein